MLIPINEEIKEGSLYAGKDLSDEGNGTFDIKIDGDEEDDTDLSTIILIYTIKRRKLGYH